MTGQSADIEQRRRYESKLYRNRVRERDLVLTAIGDAQREQRGGTDRLLVLRGPVGIGKSWLLQHLDRRSISEACEIAEADCHVTNVFSVSSLLTNQGLLQAYQDIAGVAVAPPWSDIAGITAALRESVRDRKEKLVVLRLDGLEDFEHSVDYDHARQGRVHDICYRFLGQGLANEYAGTVVIILATAREVQKLLSISRVPSLNDIRRNIDLQAFADSDVVEMLEATQLAIPVREQEIRRIAQGNPLVADMLGRTFNDDANWQAYGNDPAARQSMLGAIAEVLLGDASLTPELRPLLFELAHCGSSLDESFNKLNRTPYVGYGRDTRTYAVIEPFATLIREARLGR